MKTTSMIFTLLFLASCGGGGGGGNSASSGVKKNSQPVALEEINLEGNTPLAAQTFDINLQLKGFQSSHENKVNEAKELIKQVIASDEFKNEVLGHTYQGKRQFANSNGLSNEEIYKKILEGSENLTPGKNNQMDLHLEAYTDPKSITVGYTFKTAKKIWMNTKYLSMYPAAKITTNMVHEWLHKLGFGHDADATKKRPYSVPYAVGYIVRDLALKM